MKPKLLVWMIVPALSIILILSYIIRGIRGDVNARDEDIIIPSENFNKESVYEKFVSDFEYQGGGLITLWFDDAWDSQYEIAFPALEENGIKAALAVPTHAIGDSGYMDWWNIQKLQYEGWEITSHTRSHECEGDRISLKNLMFELAGAKVDLESYKIYAENFVAPCGTITKETTEEVKKYYASQRTSDAGLNPIPVKEPHLIKTYVLNSSTTLDDVKNMINEAVKDKGWVVIAFHQIDDSGQEYAVNPALFNQIIKEINESRLQTVLPVQALSIK